MEAFIFEYKDFTSLFRFYALQLFRHDQLSDIIYFRFPKRILYVQ